MLGSVRRWQVAVVAGGVVLLACVVLRAEVGGVAGGGVGDRGCNEPPFPGPGEEVTWTAAGSPYDICQSHTIPATARVIVEAGVEVNFQSGTTLFVEGTFDVQGVSGSPVRLTHVAVFPPMVHVSGGEVNADFVEFSGQVRVSGGTVVIHDSRFIGSRGVLITDELSAEPPFLRVARCSFESSQMSISDAVIALEENTFVNTPALVLRGYAALTGPNSFAGEPLTIIRERLETAQPLFVDNVTGSGASHGLVLVGGRYFLGAGNVLAGNGYPLLLEGGLERGSVVPATGNVNNAVDVVTGGFTGFGRWPALGVPYHITEPSGDLPGGNLLISPGVTILVAPDAGLFVRSTRRVIFEGLPEAPIVLDRLDPQRAWQGLVFNGNQSEGPRLEYCAVRGASFGVISTDNPVLDVTNCVFEGNGTGLNCNTFGTATITKTQFLGNGTGVSMSDTGHPALADASLPNSIEGNGVGIDAFDPGSGTDARFVWWGDPSGPQHPDNPDGQGDSVVGPGASNVDVMPFLTSRPDYANTPPVVRVAEPGFEPEWHGWSLGYSGTWGLAGYLLISGQPFIVQWEVQDGDTIVGQRVELRTSAGDVVVADNLPGDVRSLEFVVPQIDPGGTLRRVSGFLRVTATDATGQAGWDQSPVLVVPREGTSGVQLAGGFAGQTFVAGEPIPDVTYTGSPEGELGLYVLLEEEGVYMRPFFHDRNGRRFVFFDPFPMVSTDRARLVMEVDLPDSGSGVGVAYVFDSGYFSIRLDPRLGLAPPAVALTSPQGGESFPGCGTVPIRWSASDAEGFYGFDIQVSLDGGRRWRLIARDLPPEARSFDWVLPESGGIDDVRVRVIARNIRFQDSTAGDDVSFRILAGCESGGPAGDFDGDGDVDIADFAFFAACFGGSGIPCSGECCAADLDGDGDVDIADFSTFSANFTGSQ